MMFKKEYLYVAMIVILTSSLAVFIASKRPEVTMEYPKERITFQARDFTVNTINGQLMVGKSHWDEAVDLFPKGKRLGMSTLYQPENLEVYLTFSEDEDILIAAHLESPDISTYRGIKVGDAASKVKETYGNNYVLIYGEDYKAGNYDLLYGKNDGNTVIFQVRNEVVHKIVLQHRV